MIGITKLQKSDRAAWGRLARGYNDFYETVLPDSDYERAWGRLLAGKEIHGLAARHDGRLVGIAHFLFHSNIWRDEVCYLQDLFVDEAARGQGAARALIDAVAAPPGSAAPRATTGRPSRTMPAPVRSMTSWRSSAASFAMTIRWSEQRSEDPQHQAVQVSPA